MIISHWGHGKDLSSDKFHPVVGGKDAGLDQPMVLVAAELAGIPFRWRRLVPTRPEVSSWLHLPFLSFLSSFYTDTKLIVGDVAALCNSPLATKVIGISVPM